MAARIPSGPRAGTGAVNSGARLLMHAAARWLHARFDRRSRLPPVETWDAEYAAGKWDYLHGLPEAGRYSVLAGYIGKLRPGGSVLDVGCGQGVLLQRLPDFAYSRYLGIDVSQSAIAAARADRGAHTAPVDRGAHTAPAAQADRNIFLAVDCEGWIPQAHFDVIVFNEVLYYLRSPMSVLERYSDSLASGGILLVSLCLAREEAAALMSRLARDYAVLDATRVTHAGSGLSWECMALQPRTNPGGQTATDQ